MLKHLKSSDIDRRKWEDCILRSANGLIYCSSYFLDVLPESWEAIVDIRSDNNRADFYYAVFPFQTERKAGIKYILQNPFIRQLGPVSIDERNDTYLRTLTDKAFNSFSYVNQYVLEENEWFTNSLGKRVCTYQLDLSNGYSKIFKEYASNRKRDLQKAKNSRLQFSIDDNLDDLIALHQRHVLPKIDTMYRWQYGQLQNLYKSLKPNFDVFIANVKSEQGNLLASALFLLFKERLTYFFSASNQENSGASTLLIDSVIQKYAAQPLLLDFNGGEIRSVANFYRQFGAHPKFILSVSINRLPAIIQSAHKILISVRRKLNWGVNVSITESWF